MYGNHVVHQVFIIIQVICVHVKQWKKGIIVSMFKYKLCWQPLRAPTRFPDGDADAFTE